MSRSGYSDDLDMWALIRYRGAVASALRGKHGQAFLKELLAGLDAMPEKKLIRHELVADGQYCALGVVGCNRGLDMTNLDPEDIHAVANAFGIADSLAREIVFMNDEYDFYGATPEQVYNTVRNWVVENIKKEEAKA